MDALFATCAKGIEPVLAQELEALGARDVEAQVGGVSFHGDRALLYQSLLWLRTANRVLVPLAEFPCSSEQELYDRIHALPWEDHLRPTMTLAVEATVRDSQLRHSHYVALKVKDAVVDRLRDRFGSRPSVDVAAPSLRIHSRILRDRATLSLDASGRSLHERGYRIRGGEAPLKETLGAALVLLTGWRATEPLVDPMCGSGTIAIEAALIGCDIAPGLFNRSPGVAHWRDFDSALWQRHLKEAGERRKAGERSRPKISASDHDPRAVRTATENARAAGVEGAVRIERRELAEVRPPAGQGSGTLLVNPPYGQRLGDLGQLGSLYTSLGDLLKRHFTGWTAFVLTSQPDLGKQIGLRPSRKTPLWNGALECRLLRYELYQGRK